MRSKAGCCNTVSYKKRGRRRRHFSRIENEISKELERPLSEWAKCFVRNVLTVKSCAVVYVSPGINLKRGVLEELQHNL
jgi:hypothetical protein